MNIMYVKGRGMSSNQTDSNLIDANNIQNYEGKRTTSGSIISLDLVLWPKMGKPWAYTILTNNAQFFEGISNIRFTFGSIFWMWITQEINFIFALVYSSW